MSAIISFMVLLAAPCGALVAPRRPGAAPASPRAGGAPKHVRRHVAVFGAPAASSADMSAMVVESKSTDTKEWLGAWAYGDAGEELVLESEGRARATTGVAAEASWREVGAHEIEVALRRPRFTPSGGFAGYASATLRGSVVKRSSSGATDVSLVANATVSSSALGDAADEVVTLTKVLKQSSPPAEVGATDDDDDSVSPALLDDTTTAAPSPPSGAEAPAAPPSATEAAGATRAADIVQAFVASIQGYKSPFDQSNSADEEEVVEEAQEAPADSDAALRAALYANPGGGDAVSYAAMARERTPKKRRRF